eukprot:CAMPEP_0197576902 /NCGR_PEP_ID=MMETSP1326-20131121/1735_1 /TAXON_ID=1155430 /ORGANISM="Genus nov. species nov., Strain RCC2288" /LENGTH=61 /DNA_ID=CAMNT_0043139881 /DNA_START=337 /DNA_END=522 /DNA_ORIENTATION=+
MSSIARNVLRSPTNAAFASSSSSVICLSGFTIIGFAAETDSGTYPIAPFRGDRSKSMGVRA